ncbi:MAG: hypothetical protein IRZ16_18805 [Myxococcaceae bacterium]|nr:hypothetical protein [Myxococcaceae bacterium]
MTETPPDAHLPANPLHALAQHPLHVPALFAEKAMASLMQLHGELMEEKERRVDLYRRLMEKEQAVAELRMYVRVLEEKLGISSGDAAPREASAQRPEPVTSAAPKGAAAARPANEPDPSGVALPRRPSAPASRPVPPARPSANDGWRAW